MFARRLLMAGALLYPGGFEMGYAMTADEVAFWQDQAALLDPDAFVFTTGAGSSATVPAGERWYLLNGWHLEVYGSGTGNWYHRPAHIGHALMLPENFTVETDGAQGNSYYYLCKPSLVTGGDSRYSTDPRGLYFDRMMRLGTLTRYQLGSANTGTDRTTAAFPTDFTDGLAVHTSTHDLAWLILLHSGGGTGLNTLNEISDTHGMRFAEETIFPFKRTTFPNIMVQGINSNEGAGNFTYLKLPADW